MTDETYEPVYEAADASEDEEVYGMLNFLCHTLAPFLDTIDVPYEAFLFLFFIVVIEGASTQSVAPVLDDGRRVACAIEGGESGGSGWNRTSLFTEEGLSRILDHCIRDERCAELYGQVPRRNQEAFAHLFRAFLVAANVRQRFDSVEAPLYDMVCNRTVEDALAFLWPLQLRYLAADAATCSINERFVLTDPRAGVGLCVCMPNRTCQYDGGSSNLLIAINFIVITLLVSFIVMQVTPLGEHFRQLKSKPL